MEASWSPSKATTMIWVDYNYETVPLLREEKQLWHAMTEFEWHIGQRRLSKHAVLHHEAHDGNHCQTAVVALRSLLSLQLLRVNAIQQLGAQAEIECTQSTFSGFHQDFMSAH